MSKPSDPSTSTHPDAPDTPSNPGASRPRTWSERPCPIRPDGSLVLGLPEPEPWMTQEELDALPPSTPEFKELVRARYAELTKDW